MERSKSQLLELTRCALWGNDPNLALFEEGVDWADVLRLAKEQTLLGLTYSAIERLPLSLRPTRTDNLKLHQRVLLNKQYNKHQVEVLAKLLELVKRAGVEKPVLLKGLGVASNYPDPTLRQCGDIDLYVGDKQYLKVWNFICAELGIEKEDSTTDHHFGFEFMKIHIEIHRYATSPSSVSFHSKEFTEWTQTQLEGEEIREVTIDGVTVCLPPYNFDLIYIFFHSWRHFLLGGVGLRQLCDWSCYINLFSDKFDRKELKRLIDLFKLHTPISLFATIAVKELGVSADKFSGFASTSERQYSKVLNIIWKGGNFGVYRPSRSAHSRTIFQRKYHSLRTKLHDMKFLMNISWVYALKFYVPPLATRLKVAIKQYKTLGNKL